MGLSLGPQELVDGWSEADEGLLNHAGLRIDLEVKPCPSPWPESAAVERANHGAAQGLKHRRGEGVVRWTTTLPARNIKAGRPRAANVE